jgi:hypothetical protein
VEEKVVDVSASADSAVLQTRSSQLFDYIGNFGRHPSDWSEDEVIALLREAFDLNITDFSTSSTCAAEVTVFSGVNGSLFFDGCLALNIEAEDGDLVNLSVSELGLLLEANKYMGRRGVAAVAELIASRS